MALPSTIDTAFVNQYSSMLYILAQQQKSKFIMNTRQEQVAGESKSFDRLGEAVVEEITVRHPATPNNEQPHTRRSCQLTTILTVLLIMPTSWP